MINIIRWKAILPTVIILGGTGLLVRFFMDGFVKNAIEKYGTRANGAKVELSDVDISFLKTSVNFRHLRITDAADPMTNVLEIERLTFKLSPKPLAWKKIVIEEASIAGIQTGTPRKYSGALSKSVKKSISKETDEGPGMADKAKEAASFALSNLKDQYDPKKLVELENLESYRKVKESQAHIQALAEKWETRVDALKTSDVEERTKAFIERIKTENYSGLEGIEKAKKDLDEAKKIKEAAAALKKELEDIKSGVTSEISRAKDTIKDIDHLKRRDMDNALKDIKTSFSAEGVTRGLIGPRWFAKLENYLGYIRKARALVPSSSKTAAKSQPPRDRKGRDVPFPFHYDWPNFHLVKAALSGRTKGELEYEGFLKDLTSDPIKVGRPILLEIAGKKASEEILFKAILDYTKDDPEERVQIFYTGLPLAGTKLGDLGGAVTVKDGAGAVRADIALKREALSGDVHFNAAPISLDHSGKTGDNLMNVLHDTLMRVKRLDVTVHLMGALSSPKFKLETSLDGEIKEALKQAFQKELDGIKVQVRARLDELVDGEKNKLMDQINGKSDGALKKLSLKDKQVQSLDAQAQKLLGNLKNKSTSSILPIDPRKSLRP